MEPIVTRIISEEVKIRHRYLFVFTSNSVVTEENWGFIVLFNTCLRRSYLVLIFDIGNVIYTGQFGSEPLNSGLI